MPKDGHLPLVVGVTGHRDLVEEDISELEDKVRWILRTLREKYPATPLIIISPLAEGADRLVARIALDEGATLIAALPMPCDEYSKDFETGSSCSEFCELLGRAERTVVMPWHQEVTSESVQQNRHLRDNQYLAVGHFVVEHCQVLIALWNGIDNGLVGGTASIVSLQLQGNTNISMQISSSFAPVQTGPVYHILTRRQSDSTVTAADQMFLETGVTAQIAPNELNILYPNSIVGMFSMKSEMEKLFGYINEFNSDICDNHENIEGKIQQSKDWFISEDKCPDDYLLALRNLFALCDSFAMVCQTRSHSTLLMIATSLPLMVIFLSIFTNIVASPLLAALYLLLMIFSYGVYRVSIRRGDQKNYLDCRALAEGLRVHFYWKLAGLEESAAHHLLNRERSEADWIRCAIKTWDLMHGGINYKRTPTTDDVSNIKKCWVEDQRNYFSRNYIKENNSSLTLEFISSGFFRTAMFVIMPSMIIFHYLNIAGATLDQWAMVAMPVVITISAALGYYNEHRLFEFHARQYQRMAALFGKGATALEQSQTNIQLCQNIIFKLGREAIVENSDWLLMHRERPVNVPKG